MEGGDNGSAGGAGDRGDVMPGGVAVSPDFPPGFPCGWLMPPFAQAPPVRKPRTMQPVISKINGRSMLLLFSPPVALPCCLINSIPNLITMG